jgi:hypothetical protein
MKKLLLFGVAVVCLHYLLWGDYWVRDGGVAPVATGFLSATETAQTNDLSSSPVAISVDASFKREIKILYDQWRYRNASTERVHYGIRTDMSEPLSRIKLRGPHMPSTLHRDMVQVLLELGVDAREAASVASAILAEAEGDGRKKRSNSDNQAREGARSR